ncbi:MAG: DUF4430 domain-containing protein [Planctomycetaceae bacterium]|nr:DUF4430 domain-containing protein [Planctomycetaceae bacterium]
MEHVRNRVGIAARKRPGSDWSYCLAYEQKNEGAGRNWTYEVNGKRADKSCGVWVLHAGDKVLWLYGKQ